jgi:hypothetical protein
MLSDSRKRSRSSRAFAWIPPETLILAGAGAFAALGRGRWVTLIGDHGLWYSELQGLLCGGHLMHEVRVPYGPISMWLIWLAARLFGPTISTVAGFVFVAGLAAVVLVASFSLAFLSRSEQWCCAALLVVVILWSPGVGNLLYPYAFATGPGMVFALAALFAQRAALRRELFPLAAVAGAAARRGAWRDLVAPLALLCTLLGLVPLWSSKTTGDWRTTPYALYAKRYFPYERPGFGLDSTPAERPLPAGLTPFDAEFRVLHRRFTAATLPSALLRRSADVAGQMWGGRGVLALFFALGLAALSAESAFALASAFGILIAYLVYALSPGAAPYYAEGYPAFALVTALGLRAAMSFLGAVPDLVSPPSSCPPSFSPCSRRRDSRPP